MVGVHTELQRLSEELRIGERLAHVLGPLFTAIRASGHAAPLRLSTSLRRSVICPRGVMARSLVGRARPRPRRGPAAVEGLACRFVHGNAFDLPEAATVFVSTGVLHHFRGPALAEFFRAQAASPALAFCHYDIAATRLAPIGAWVFHHARMRHPLGRHDGVASALRAHDDATLLRAAFVPGIRPLLYEPRGMANPFCTTLRPVIGVRPQLEAPLRLALGRASRRLVGPE